MMAKSVQKGLHDQFVKSGLLSYSFSCAVFNEPDQFEIIGEGWKVPITPDIVGRPRAAACVKISKDSNSSIYKATRWTLMPNFDLCQFREKGKKKIFSKTIKKSKFLKITFLNLQNNDDYL